MEIEELERLHDLCLDWDNSPMPDGAETRVSITCGQVRNIIATYRERDSYKAALGDVSNPLRYLERQAEEAGRSLGPMAYTIANDLPFVQSIARTALERRGSE